MQRSSFAALILAVLLLVVSFSYFGDRSKWESERGGFLSRNSSMLTKEKDIRDSAGREIVLYRADGLRTQDLLKWQTEQTLQLRQDLQLMKRKLSKVRSSVELDVQTSGVIEINPGDSLNVAAGFDSGAVDTTKLLAVYFKDSSDDFMTLSGAAGFRPTNKGFVFETMAFDYSIKDTFTVTHIEQIGNLFRRQKMEIMLTSANPKSTIKDAKSIYVPIQKKWFQRWYVQAGAGVICGVYLAGKL